jgi:serine/threonine protein kinase
MSSLSSFGPIATPSGSADASVSLPRSLFGYEVVGYIGEGAGSQIYCVTDASTGQVYALKHVVRKQEKHIRFIEQLEAEYDVGRLVVHANVRRVVDFKVTRKLFKIVEAALVMEMFDGYTLERELPRSYASMLSIFRQTALGLRALHTAGYIHCDLKPNNILYNNRLDVKVIDLGQACRIGTAKARIQGTPDYIAPEQVKCKPLSIATDVYNLGATMYWCLSGQKIPTLYTAGKGENAIVTDEFIPSPSQLNPQIPEGLSNFVMECVRLNPAKRPPDMGEVVKRLELFEHLLAQREGRSVA